MVTRNLSICEWNCALPAYFPKHIQHYCCHFRRGFGFQQYIRSLRPTIPSICEYNIYRSYPSPPPFRSGGRTSDCFGRSQLLLHPSPFRRKQFEPQVQRSSSPILIRVSRLLRTMCCRGNGLFDHQEGNFGCIRHCLRHKDIKLARQV